MIKQYLRKLIIVVLIVTQDFVFGQQYVGDVCTLTSTGSAGECKLFSQCESARQELQKNNRFPQTCGFKGTEAVVCCQKDEKEETQETPQRNPGDISKRKCREYAAYVFETKKPPILLINVTEVTRNECGHKVQQLIVGGTQATRKEFPHMAAIGYEPTGGEILYLCGGTILSRSYILTAAHCLSDYSQGDAKWVKLGVTSLEDTGHRQEIKVAERIPYPQYKSSSHYHDIGLLKLEKNAKMNPYARPACLYLNPQINTKSAIATGWGHTTWGGEGSDKLLKVTIDLFDHDFCNSSYKNQISRKLRNGILDDIQLCAGSLREEKDTCQGDSGGPLQIYHTGDKIKCMYDIVGITSFGKACSGSPGVYVRVSHYVKWIEDIVWP